MKTYLIWNNFDEGLKFGWVEGDWSHLHQVYMNSSATTEAQEDELDALQHQIQWYTNITDWMIGAELNLRSGVSGIKFIEIGFIP